jgi:tRNA (mo5U34)-methyltransferase
METLDAARAQSWYHTLELPGYTTPGIFDLRPHVADYGLPEDLSGKRALEVGTWDGFWAFELERRGAEVVALDLDDERDLDWPPRRRPETFPDARRGAGFALAKAALGSKAERVSRSVYAATPEELGTFDLVFCGSVLIHLRDQMLALERIAGLVKPGGLFVSAEEYDRTMDLLPIPAARFRADREQAVVFWLPSRRAWRAMLSYAGFGEIREHSRFTMRSTQGYGVRHAVHHARR